MNYWDYPRIFQPIHSLDDDPHFLTFCGFNHHVLSQQKSIVVLSLSLPISLFVQPPLFRWNGGETGSTQAPAALALAALAAAHCMACIAGSHCRVLCSARLALEALELEDLAWQRWPPWMFLLGKRCDTLNRMDKWMDVIVTEYFFKKKWARSYWMQMILLGQSTGIRGMFAQQKKGVPYSNSGIFSSSVLIYPRAT